MGDKVADPDPGFTPRRLEALRRMRDIVRWSTECERYLADPAVADEQIKGLFVIARKAWPAFQGRQDPKTTAAMYVTAWILIAGDSEEYAAAGIRDLHERYPELLERLDPKKFRAACRTVQRAPGKWEVRKWEAITVVLRSVGIRYDPASLEAKFSKWLNQTFVGLAFKRLLDERRGEVIARR